MDFSADEIPERLLQGDREVDNHFSPEESLYIRCFSDHVTENGRVLALGFRFPNFSCNRERYGELADVLYPVYLDWGVATYQVRQVPSPLLSGDQKRTFDIKVEHDPLEHNYPHCEIRAFEERSKTDSVPKAVKKRFRQEMSERASVLKTPDLSSQEWAEVKEERNKLAEEIIRRSLEKHRSDTEF